AFDPLAKGGTSTINLSGGSQALGGIEQNTTSAMHAYSQDVMTASTAAAACPVNVEFASLGNNASLTGPSATPLFQIDGDLNVSASALNLTGPADAVFIINVFGKATFSGGTNMILSGGITPDHILWNFVGPGGDINSNGNSNLRGTIIALDRNIIISGGSH